MKQILPVLAVVAAFGRSAPAQDAPAPLTLHDAARLAAKSNRGVAAAEAEAGAATARVQQARSGALPRVNYSESVTRSDNPVFAFSSRLMQRRFEDSMFQTSVLNRPGFVNNYQSRVMAEETLYDGGRTKRAVQSATLAKDLSDQDSRRTRLEAVALVTRAYCDAQLGTEQLRVTTKALDSARADLERAERRRAAGVTTDSEVLSLQVHVARLQEDRIRQTAELEVLHAAINDVLGLPLETPHTLSTDLKPLPLQQEVLAAAERGAAAGPQIRQARLAEELAGVQSGNARAGYLPTVTAMGGVEADRQNPFNKGGVNWLVSVGLNWNLFNGFADKARITESVAEIRRARAERERAESATRLQVRRAWAELTAAQQRIETAQASIAAAEESLRIIQNRYSAGLTTVTELLRAETDILGVRTRHLAAIRDQRVAAAMLELAAGTLTPESEVLN